jgi:hypothetical protein
MENTIVITYHNNIVIVNKTMQVGANQLNQI